MGRAKVWKAPSSIKRFKVGDDIWDLYWMDDLDRPTFRHHRVVGVGDVFTTVARVDREGRVCRAVSKIQTVHASTQFSTNRRDLLIRHIKTLEREITLAKSVILRNQERIDRTNFFLKDM